MMSVRAPCKPELSSNERKSVEKSGGEQTTQEVKILVLQGSLDEALRRAIKQRDSLK
jgi:hypothetical protein